MSISTIGKIDKQQLQPLAPVAALILLAAVFAAVNPNFLTATNLRSLADQSAIPIILGLGATFVIMMGAIDLSIEGTLAASAFVVSLLVANNVTDIDIGLYAIPAGIALGAALGLLNGTLNTRARIPSFMVTLGTWSVGLGIAQVLLRIGNQPPRITVEAREWAIGRLFGVSYAAYAALALVVVSFVIQRRTLFGRYAFAIGGAEPLAVQAGVKVRAYKTAVFTLAGAYTGFAGALLIARTGVADISASSGFLFTTIAGVVIGGTLLSGGKGGVLGSAVGILTMVVLRNGLILMGVDPFLQSSVQGALVVVAVAATSWGARARMRFVN